MSGKTSLLVFLLLFCVFFPLYSAPVQAFNQTRTEVDGVLQRVRAKISYSWMRSNEYFRLMVASAGEKVVTETDVIRSRTSVKAGEFKKKALESKEEVVEKTQTFYKKQSDSISNDISEKTARVKEEIKEMGDKVYDNASQEVGKTVDSFKK